MRTYVIPTCLAGASFKTYAKLKDPIASYAEVTLDIVSKARDARHAVSFAYPAQEGKSELEVNGLILSAAVPAGVTEKLAEGVYTALWTVKRADASVEGGKVIKVRWDCIKIER